MRSHSPADGSPRASVATTSCGPGPMSCGPRSHVTAISCIPSRSERTSARRFGSPSRSSPAGCASRPTATAGRRRGSRRQSFGSTAASSAPFQRSWSRRPRAAAASRSAANAISRLPLRWRSQAAAGCRRSPWPWPPTGPASASAPSPPARPLRWRASRWARPPSNWSSRRGRTRSKSAPSATRAGADSWRSSPECP